jgi:predicted acylesterase/phospholipase RssA/CRP-like cAMP-binding protein
MNSTDQKVRDMIESYFDRELHPQLLEQLETRVLNGGEWLFRQGDAGDSLYFLVRGRMQVWVESDDASSQPRLLGEVVPGESVGEVGLISGEPRSASIQAIRDSLLIRIDRQTCEELAARDPALVIKLAGNVVKMLQRSTSTGNQTDRSLKTIVLLPLSSGNNVSQFCDEFTHHLSVQTTIVDVSPDNLSAKGAPLAQLKVGEELPDGLKVWLSDLEDQHEIVLYRCPAGDSPWSRFAVRQSDIVLMVADAKDDPDDVAWEPKGLSINGTTAGRRALLLLQHDRSAISNTRRWLEGRHVNFHLHIQSGLISDVQRAVRIITGKATGLVFGAGAARGLAAIGVYKALTEAGIEIDWVGGTSIGSITAAAVAAGWSPDLAIDNSRQAFKVGKPFSDFTIPVMSLLRGKRMKDLLKKHLDFQIEDLPLPYYCVSTNLGRGTRNIHETGSLVDAIRASAALPGVMPPMVVNQELTIDGAILDNLPVDIMQQKPVGKIIAVDFSASVPTKVDYTETPSPWAVLRGRWLPFSRRYKVPKLTSIMLKSTEAATLEEVRRLGKMADLLIDPDIKKFGMTDVKSFDQIVQAGYERACEKLANWP